MQNCNVEVYIVDVTKGHETIISKVCTHIYYVIEGKGIFEINGKKYNVKSGSLIEAPPHVVYAYSGKMKLLLIMNPPWFKGNEEIVKKLRTSSLT